MRFAKRTNWDLELNPLAKAVVEHRAAGKPLIDLTVSNPTECEFTYDIEAILGALRNAETMKYEPNPKGLEVARSAVAGYYAERGDEVAIDDIFLTTGTSEAYSWVMRLLCDVGDEVLVPSPGYPLLDFLADINDVHLVRYPLFYDHGWHYDFHALEQAITPRTRAVVVVHPNNPTGNYCKPGERERLNQICSERRLAVIADEVFLDFALDGVPRASFVSNGRQAGEPLTFTLSGISKICGLPQMKLAWVVVGGIEAVRRETLERLEVIADTYLSMNAPVQHAGSILLASRQKFQEQVLRRILTNLQYLERGIAASRGALCLAPEGGWSVVVRLGHSGRDRAAAFLRGGILTHPGDFYDLSRDEFVVLSLLVGSEHFAAIDRVE